MHQKGQFLVRLRFDELAHFFVDAVFYLLKDAILYLLLFSLFDNFVSYVVAFGIVGLVWLQMPR